MGNKILTERMTFPIQSNSFKTAITEKRPLSLQEINEDQVSMIQDCLESEVTSLLCVPVPSNQEDIVTMLVCLVNKDSFCEADEDLVGETFRCMAPILHRAKAYEEEKRLREECQSLLTVAKSLFTHLDDVTLLLREIMAQARHLTKAERCSLFLLDKERNELVAKVFDGNVAEDGTETSVEVRIPANQGIAGYVATSGELLNIHDAYAHPLFYRKMDETTGFKTRNILCFPIKDDKGVIGVAELCNKINERCFSFFDEEIAKAFSIYCGISIMHSLMWKKVRDAQHRSRLSNELMMYHMQVPPEDVTKLAEMEILSPEHFSEDFAKLTFIPRSLKEQDTPLAVISMFEDMGMIHRWRIPIFTLSKFVLMVRKGYRDPPYHNWMHAFSVAHFCYLLHKNVGLMGNYLSELESLALFIACLCHDLDHRGTNNNFQVASKSDLAALYCSEGSVMERHHFAQAMAILNTDGCNVLENLSRKEYTQCLDCMRDVILATDLAHHLRIIEDIETMIKGFDVDNQKHHQLLLCLLITCCDLSDQTKDWKSSKKIAELIYNEFFSQGDLEKAMGVRPSEMMDREKACIPELQIGFIENIVLPAYRILALLFPEMHEATTAVDTNRLFWERMRDVFKRRYSNSTSSLDMFEDESLEQEVLALSCESD
ncbi:cGMP-dependent 3',5'-cyclic phosphodiesterase-like isoform X2 [Stegodyphus dumicola]|uniref:cGMP-dependent 3',5'-cyclic phosphodiesterase-like isoform X2 n=1 Tax=Stegodyphus dumicola TaxID=202533 RepID=UPI0015A7B06B|nr:cGMP-dependent 3',5'-cyclic phosphodiesterase-like isoform X2 [Stegodyphus dumicola]